SLMIDKMLAADDRRDHLQELATHLNAILSAKSYNTPISHIQPMIVGDAKRALSLAAKLRDNDIIALPIRVPTVPPGTERIRFSLSAALSHSDLDKLQASL
ncbi:MAG: aminotransferase class I/II-fold pyridoxal phosphate-dependent enzyme, partial [Muribaculaceae bacterium]|nr:aminotransferase class I/II-fold pyridoxal phosphate-dependent enzyme [Muribaculaceae bacterium]